MFENTKAVMFDLDGTVYCGDQIVSGAREAIQHCRDLGKSVVFHTNNSAETRSQIFHRLRGLEVECTLKEVLTSGYLAALYVLREKLNNVYISGSQNLVNECERLGVHSVPAEDAENLLVGFDPEFSYGKLAQAVRVAQHAARIIACDKERVSPGAHGQIFPRCGGMIASIEWCAQRVADYSIGKPNTLMIETACDQLGIAADEILVVGDTYESDIVMANKCGSPSVFIGTQVYGDTVSIEHIGELANLVGHTQAPESKPVPYKSRLRY